MIHINLLKTLLILNLLLIVKGASFAQNKSSFEEAEAFSSDLNEEYISSGYITVPENWEKAETNSVKIAISIIKSKAENIEKKAVVFIQGGPGAQGIQNTFFWKNHPLRKSHDIVLFDVRGTGFSEPRLCPDLGKQFLEIFSKNQNRNQDKNQKIRAVLQCEDELLNKGVDLSGYNSGSVAKDLHHMMTSLGHKSWSVYGISYGTYIAQVYSNLFPDDVDNLILDSAISNVSTFYEENTSSYVESLFRVFKKCKEDEICNNIYPNLEERYYKVIKELEQNPITVKADRKILASETFTFNAEDFKIAIQQALYNKKIIEIIPLMIHQFEDRNKEGLGNLVPAFSSLLQMDYGVYYGFSCNEVLANNSIEKFKENARGFDKMQGELSFYEVDFEICQNWGLKQQYFNPINFELSNLYERKKPILVFSGEYDPITPFKNAKHLKDSISHLKIIHAYSLGHVPSITTIGSRVVSDFLESPEKDIDANVFNEATDLTFVNNVILNAGIAKMGTTLTKPAPIFLAPILISILILIPFVLILSVKLIKNRYKKKHNKYIRFFIISTSILGLSLILGLFIALVKTAQMNTFILAFGVPEDFNYLFWLRFVFLGMLGVSFIHFFMKLKKIENKGMLFSALFSNVLLLVYLMYWGVM